MVNTAATPLYRKIRRSLFLSILLLLLLLLISALIRLIILPRTRISQILLESTLNLSNEELLALGGIQGDENYISLDEKELESRFESSPLIRNAYVEKQFPATLKIVLYGRSPLGLMMVREGMVHKPLVFDEYGVLYHSADISPYRDLPLISGLEFDQDKPSMLPEPLNPLLKDLKSLKGNSPLLFSQISEINIKGIEGALYEIQLYTLSYKLPVVLSSRITDSLMKKILLVLDSLDEAGEMNLYEYADFRTDQVVLKIREGN